MTTGNTVQQYREQARKIEKGNAELIFGDAYLEKCEDPLTRFINKERDNPEGIFSKVMKP